MPDLLHILRSASSADALVSFDHPDPLTALALALTAALLRDFSEDDRAATGLLLATRHGCLHIDRDFDLSRRDDPRFASPAAFSRTLPSTLAAEIALANRLTGPHLTFLPPLNVDPLHFVRERAAAWLPAFKLRHVVAGFADLPPRSSAPHVELLLLGPG